MEVAMPASWPRVAFVIALLLLVPTVALADGGGGGGGGGGDAAALKKQTPEYTAGVKAIESKDFARAMTLLEVAVQRTPDDADAWNYLAYATRKNGDPAKAIPLYEKALALDPRHLGAHEYIGEAYLDLNDLPKAKEHLARLNKLCLLSCEEYRDLKKAVQAYEKAHGEVKPAVAR
jgi:tetratricopeptide (TPR) repeat protein